jgi:hypothetical protein
MIGELSLVLMVRAQQLQLTQLREELASSRYLSDALQRQLHRLHGDYQLLSDRYTDLHNDHESYAENRLRMVRAYSERCNSLEDRAVRAEAALKTAQEAPSLSDGLLPCSCSVCREHRTPEPDLAEEAPSLSEQCYSYGYYCGKLSCKTVHFPPEVDMNAPHWECSDPFCLHVSHFNADGTVKVAEEAPSCPWPSSQCSCGSHRMPGPAHGRGWPHDSGDLWCGLCSTYACSTHP